MRRPGVVIVSKPTDLLATALAISLEAQGIRTERIVPAALGDSSIALRDQFLAVNGSPVGGILFRASPDSTFSLGFVEEDRAFSDAEIRATWLAAFHLESVLTVNRYDATAWFEGLRWTVWRRKLLQAGIPVSDFAFGDVQTKGESLWYPYSTSVPEFAPERVTRSVLGSALSSSVRRQVSLVVCNQAIAGETKTAVLATARLMNDLGMRIVEIATDWDDRILWLNPQPTISEPGYLKRATELLAALYDGHLHRW